MENTWKGISRTKEISLKISHKHAMKGGARKSWMLST